MTFGSFPDQLWLRWNNRLSKDAQKSESDLDLPELFDCFIACPARGLHLVFYVLQLPFQLLLAS